MKEQEGLIANSSSTSLSPVSDVSCARTFTCSLVDELVYLLEERGILDHDLTERMVRAVGFRNFLVHEYGKVDLEIVYRVAQQDIQDLQLFMKTIMKQFG
jgi:hypothetical protein